MQTNTTKKNVSRSPSLPFENKEAQDFYEFMLKNKQISDIQITSVSDELPSFGRKTALPAKPKKLIKNFNESSSTNLQDDLNSGSSPSPAASNPFLNDTLIIVSLAESTIVPFTYSENQPELEKIE